jgi:hypothetical protein
MAETDASDARRTRFDGRCHPSSGMAFGIGLLFRGLRWGPRRLALWAGANPLRTAGGVGALVAAWVIVASLSSGTGVIPDLAGVTLERFLRFSRAHPAYPVAVVVGSATLLLLR